MIYFGTVVLCRWQREPNSAQPLSFRRSLRFSHTLSYTINELEEQICKSVVNESEVLVILDTSYFNFEANSGKLKVNAPKIGYLNKTKGVGFGFQGAQVSFPRTWGCPCRRLPLNF